MLTHTFYISFLIIGLLIEIGAFLNPRHRKEALDCVGCAIKNVNPNGYLLIEFMYSSLTIVGLFTFQWILFAILVLFTFVPKKRIWWIRTDAFISLTLILLIVVNKYYLDYPITDYILRLLF